MLFTKHTPRKNNIIAAEFVIRAWGGLTVSIEMTDADSPKDYYQIEFTEKELRSMLRKIEERKEEIDIQMTEWRKNNE